MRVSLTSIEFYHLPEFKALCERAGIRHDLPTLGMVITVGPNADDPVNVTHTYRTTKEESRDAIDVTTLHNDKYRTYRDPVVVEKL